MKIHRKILSLLSIVIPFCSFVGQNSQVMLGESDGIHLTVDLLGGAFVDFRLSKQTDNPFSWYIPINEMPENNCQGACFQGHFMCLGRWGAPTVGEMRAGVPHNGEAGNKLWKQQILEGDSLLVIRTEAPLDGVSARRKIQFDKINAVFKVTDYINSHLTVGRPFNMVQHATIGPPFLTSSTIINSNATVGFMQHLSYPNPHACEYVWPVAIIDTLGNQIDLTRTDISQSYVSTHLFSEKYGWITATEPQKGLLIGYIWNTEEYAWLNLWHEMKEGKPCAKGLEFGTTGIGVSYQDLLAIDTRFHGVNSFVYLDAWENLEKSFLCFQIFVPASYAGVKQIELKEDKIVIVEKGSRNEIVINHHYYLK